MAPCSSDAR